MRDGDGSLRVSQEDLVKKGEAMLTAAYYNKMPGTTIRFRPDLAPQSGLCLAPVYVWPTMSSLASVADISM